MDMQGQISDPKAALTFILAGKSYATFVSTKSGNRYTYKIELAEKRNPTDMNTWFVSLLMGPDNWSNYKYIGMIKNNQFRWTSKAKVAQDAPSVLGFGFVFDSLQANAINNFEVWHEGKCGRCGKKLTVPESIASGFGPDCIMKVMQGMADSSGRAVRGDLNFDGSAREARAQQMAKQYDIEHGEYGIKVNGVAAPAQTDNLDAEIRRRVEQFKAEAPENYFQDGELDEKQAFSVAYNKFRVQLERGQ